MDEQTLEPTETAREFSKHFEEIMIDEYQDSNQVQEDILTAISREHQGVGNMFMVGDVKQSIYRFRMARPVCLWKNTTHIHQMTVDTRE